MALVNQGFLASPIHYITELCITHVFLYWEGLTFELFFPCLCTCTCIRLATRGSSGVVGWMVSGMMGLLFRLGSLLYLAATAILCLDVIILHRYVHVPCCSLLYLLG